MLTRPRPRFTLHPQTSLRTVAEKLPFTYTGADLYALCSDAMLKAITRQASAVDAKIKALPNGPVSTAYFFDHYASKEDVSVMVTEEDFHAAKRELVGSVSAKELEHYARVRRSFEAKDEKAKIDVNGAGGNADGARSATLVDRTAAPNTEGLGRAINGKGKGKGKGKAKMQVIAPGTSDVDSDGYAPRANNDDHDDDLEAESTGHITRMDHRRSNRNGHVKDSSRSAQPSFIDPSKDDENELYG